MRDVIITNLQTRFRAYADLIEQSDDAALTAKLNVAKHKSLTEHLWCVVGARESYTRALEQGQWDGFSCSLTQFTQADIANALNDSAHNFTNTLGAIGEWTAARDELLATLAEHEVMHEGQIIRHVLAVGGSLPESWIWA